MGNGIKLDVPDVITEGRVKTERDLCDEPVGYGVDHRHILIFQGHVCVIGVGWNAGVGDEDPVIDRVIFYSIRAIQWIKLDFGDDVEWTMLVSDVDDTVIGITDKDLAKVGSDDNASSLGSVDEANHLV